MGYKYYGLIDRNINVNKVLEKIFMEENIKEILQRDIPIVINTKEININIVINGNDKEKRKYIEKTDRIYCDIHIKHRSNTSVRCNAIYSINNINNNITKRTDNKTKDRNKKEITENEIYFKIKEELDKLRNNKDKLYSVFRYVRDLIFNDEYKELESNLLYMYIATVYLCSNWSKYEQLEENILSDNSLISASYIIFRYLSSNKNNINFIDFIDTNNFTI